MRTGRVCDVHWWFTQPPFTICTQCGTLGVYSPRLGGLAADQMNDLMVIPTNWIIMSCEK